MDPTVLKYRLWALALRQNPQTAVYTTRKLATAPGATDTPTTYSLLRVTYEEPEDNELAMVGATLADSWKVWYIYQADLDNCSGPTPLVGFELTLPDGTTWVIRNVKAVSMGMAFRCLCKQARPL